MIYYEVIKEKSVSENKDLLQNSFFNNHCNKNF